MERGATRLGAAALALAALWIAVYWWTPAPSRRAAQVSFGQAPSSPESQDSRMPPPPELEATSVASPAQDAEPDDAPLSAALPLIQPGEVTPPTFTEHVVASGDSAEEISARYYGTSRHWRSIMHANPLQDFTRLRVGQTLQVPKDPANVQGLVRGDTGGGLDPDAAITMEYTVRSGDTLSEIAQRIYGRSVLWTVIRDANLDVVGPTGRRLNPGQVLVIPPAPG